jgi:hypothetical protein
VRGKGGGGRARGGGGGCPRPVARSSPACPHQPVPAAEECSSGARVCVCVCACAYIQKQNQKQYQTDVHVLMHMRRQRFEIYISYTRDRAPYTIPNSCRARSESNSFYVNNCGGPQSPRARGVVVSHPLSMREALGSIPSVSIILCSRSVQIQWRCAALFHGTCIKLTPVGFEPTPLRTGALSQRLRPLGQSVLIDVQFLF